MQMNSTLYPQNVLSKLFFMLFLICPFYHSGFSQNCERLDIRSIDGTCNNLRNGDWGSADIPLERALKADYAARNPFSGMVTNRPNPRKISNEVFSQSRSIPSKKGLSSFVFTWAQFIDHDMGQSPRGNTKANIKLPAGERNLTEAITFTRSKFFPGTGSYNTAEQINELTSWIDGSQVYGSDRKRAKWLRTFKNGKLKTSKGNLLPYNTTNGEKGGRVDSNAPKMDNDVGFRGTIFVAGDKRAGEQPGLTALHVLFVREHNRLCDVYRKQGVHGDEKLYQLARKQVGAIIQAITYNEFLPALGVRLAPYRGYNPNVKPDVLNVFANAAYRIGHTMVTEDLPVVGDDCTPLRDNLPLEEVFFNPTFIANLGIEPFLKGLSVQVQEEFDAKIVDGLRNFLFNIPQLPGTFGLDLASLNIQRGRDHGLSDYNSYRAKFTGRRISRFNEINRSPVIWKKLEAVYNGKIHNIDPWVGMLAEEQMSSSNMGITMHNILREQFESVRDGDYYFYRNDPTIHRNDKSTLDRLKLVDIIKRNTPLTSLQDNLFKAEKCSQTNPDLTEKTCNGNLIKYGNGRITMTRTSSATTYFQVFDKSWKTIFDCNRNCDENSTAYNLKNGLYRVFVYDKNFEIFCIKEINLSGASTAIDRDKDGVLANLDCNDNDPNLTLVGAKCDDGDPNTRDDRVSEFCFCSGKQQDTIKEVVACGGMTIRYGSNSLSIDNVPNKNYKFNIVRTDPSFKSIENCVFRNCGSSKAYQNLRTGRYWIRIWSNRWELVCDQYIDLNNSLNSTPSSRNLVTPIMDVNRNKHTNFLYPNPTKDRVNLVLPEFVGQTGTLRLFNNLGQIVKEQVMSSITTEPIELEVVTLPIGIYQLQVVVKGQAAWNHKVLIQ